MESLIGHVTEVVRLMEGNGHVTVVVVILMEGEWLCYRGGKFNGEIMIMLHRWPV